MATGINAVWYCHTDQWRRIENQKQTHTKYVQMIFDKDIKAIQWRKDSLAANVAGTIGYPRTNRNVLQSKFTPFTKINSK